MTTAVTITIHYTPQQQCVLWTTAGYLDTGTTHVLKDGAHAQNVSRNSLETGVGVDVRQGLIYGFR